ncbi:Hypothetical predicted protein [Podarcis lilfordi]|uniref:Uncharacterized protein n=1 Tax=Podarcis lilfordi TaxID=74358 RepID=A0AA35NUK4_9SAUR|nr:Hypothetical predicted protein [Podarcis lilfordi]
MKLLLEELRTDDRFKNQGQNILCRIKNATHFAHSKSQLPGEEDSVLVHYNQILQPFLSNQTYSLGLTCLQTKGN